MLGKCCQIIGVIVLGLALVAAVVSVSTVWTVGQIETDPLIVSGGAEETIYLSLWRRRVEREPGDDESATWRNYVDGQRGDEYCPERNGKTYDDVFTRIQAAQACALITLIMSLFTLIAAVVNLFGFHSRASFGVPAFFTIGFGCGSIIAWNEFYNICSDNFCQRYVNQPQATSGICGMTIGFAFMCVCIGLTFFGVIPMCASSGSRKVIVTK